MSKTTIVWGPVKDHHVKGRSAGGEWWVRLDRAGQVIAVYAMIGDTKEKWVPAEPESLEQGKLRSQEMLAQWQLAEELAGRAKTNALR